MSSPAVAGDSVLKPFIFSLSEAQAAQPPAALEPREHCGGNYLEWLRTHVKYSKVL